MNRFKKIIASTVTTLMIVMAFALLSVKEAEAKNNAPFDKSYLPPAARAKARHAAFYGAGIYRLRTRMVAGRGINNDRRSNRRTSRRLGLLPYLEQDNIY